MTLDGTLHFEWRMLGIEGAEYDIEATTDFQAWEPVAVMTGQRVPVTVRFPATKPGQQFFRAKIREAVNTRNPS